jgi:hypothetical protein
MPQLARAAFQTEWFASAEHALRPARIVGPFVAILAAIIVTGVMVAESRLTAEQHLAIFEASHPYP